MSLYPTASLGLPRLDWEVLPGTFDLGDTSQMVGREAVLYGGETALAAGEVKPWTGPAGPTPRTVAVRPDTTHRRPVDRSVGVSGTGTPSIDCPPITTRVGQDVRDGDPAATIVFQPVQGIPGVAGEIVGVTVETLPAESDATIEMGGTPTARTFALGVPEGKQGPEGPPQPAWLVTSSRAALSPLLTPYSATDPLRGPVCFGTADAYTAGLSGAAGRYPNLANTGTALDAQEPATASQRPGRSLVNGRWGIDFDGVDDLLFIPDDSRLDVAAGASLTVVLVFEAAAGAAGRVLISKKGTPAASTPGWMLRSASGTPNQMIWHLSDGTNMASLLTGRSSDFTSPTDVVIATVDAANVGVGSTPTKASDLAATSRLAGDASNALSLVLGRQGNSGTGTQFPMRLLAWAVFDRAISSAEALRISNAAIGRTAPTASEVVAEEVGTPLVQVVTPGGAAPSPVSLTALPAALNNRALFHGNIFTQDPITTRAGVQYTVFVGSDAYPRVAWRTLPSGAWSPVVNLGTQSGNPFFGVQTTLDLHNSYSIAASSDGRLHVCGNMHAVPLKYAMSAAGDPTTWSAGTMIGTDESLVTYPVFVTLPNGTLLFFYRNGGSGAGDLVLNRYNNDGTWTRVGTIISGAGESVYPHRIAVNGSTGAIHLACEIRGTLTGNTTHDVCHIQSLDGGTTWKSMSGTTLTLPLTPATLPVIVPTAPTNSGLINNGGAAVDATGNPHFVYRRNDGRGRSNIFHVYWTGAAWRDVQVTRFDHVIGVGGVPAGEGFPRPQLVVSPSGRLIVLYTTAHPSHRGTLWGVDITDPDRMREFPILRDFDLVEHEITFDSRAMTERGELHMVLTPGIWDSTSTRYREIYQWAAQRGYVASVDLNGAALWPDCRPLRMDVLGSVTGADIDITSGTLANIAGVGSIAVGSNLTGAELWARMSVRGRVSAGGTTMTVDLRETAGTAIAARLSFDSTTTAQKDTPWVPLVEVSAAPGIVRPMTSLTGAGTGRISVTVEIGRMSR